jgi:hypothetical protein
MSLSRPSKLFSTHTVMVTPISWKLQRSQLLVTRRISSWLGYILYYHHRPHKPYRIHIIGPISRSAPYIFQLPWPTLRKLARLVLSQRQLRLGCLDAEEENVVLKILGRESGHIHVQYVYEHYGVVEECYSPGSVREAEVPYNFCKWYARNETLLSHFRMQ